MEYGYVVAGRRICGAQANSSRLEVLLRSIATSSHLSSYGVLRDHMLYSWQGQGVVASKQHGRILALPVIRFLHSKPN